MPLAGAHTKFVMMGPPGVLSRRITDSVRSLKNFEHVNAGSLTAAEAGAPAAVRHWFFGRKRFHGFLLQGFPTLRQHAILLDEWLDARDEALTGCLWLDMSPEAALAQASNCVDSERDRAESEVRVWFQNHADNTASVADFYEIRGQLFRFDAETTSFEDVSHVARAITADR